ncbi:hypothetical protein [Amaricoccus solimangrovi]|uniref:Peptidase M4 C-terminal domain-containing protein n=1 Tax=Amaricoccus solimangrovi TaxID=2589815 RepID=A0A501WNZ4_9RHOB|nr:hypothetical protein [Amaricoccus solimangrovi]TPE49914.1 hypothetical protein FJM51_13195 [Amaricoccus solimangrovi]
MSHAEAKPERTRARLYPQSPVAGTARLETVELAPRRGMVRAGPEDDRMYVAVAPGKRPYGEDRGRGAFPPYEGLIGPAVAPGPDGHFDHLGPGDPGFRQVHLYGCARMALDIWEGYLDRRIPWHFERDFDKLEVLALSAWNNAHMGYGYLEAGECPLEDGTTADYALDFDVLAHEVGHAIMMSFAGEVPAQAQTAEYGAFHEASADWAALVASMHFEQAVADLLEMTRGDLDGFNQLTRFGELSPKAQIRQANNTFTMWDFQAGWHDEHELALPIIAALYDAFVQIYKTILVRGGVIPPGLSRLAERAELAPGLRAEVSRRFARWYARRPEAFHDALVEAREIAAVMLIGLWEIADPRRFSFAALPGLLREVDRREFDGAIYPVVRGCFGRRGVGLVPPGPRLRPPDASSHMHSARTAMPD